LGQFRPSDCALHSLLFLILSIQIQVPSIEANWAIDMTLIQILNSFAKISITGVILGLEANLSIIAQSPWR
jgi:hypothetical protein